MGLPEWIDRGRQNGTITDVQVVICAYGMTEHQAIAWIAPIVNGEISEADALEAARGQWEVEKIPRWQTSRWVDDYLNAPFDIP